MKNLSLLAILFLFSVTSCKKYDEGGLTSKADKRLSAHTWKLDKYLRNGVDETSQLLITNFSENFSESGVINRIYADSNGDLINEPGTWTFDNDKLQIKLSGLGSIELTNQTSTVTSSDYNILRLKKDELWYYYENGGSRHEFHLIK